ncbi:MAG TPA: type II toxin-antitoxin system PemK/MazF family toxin [Pirellulales bacterium]|nr:type II toxin-antitoxin system PemK/MazF family toxin [Pirellulales bacterium]
MPKFTRGDIVNVFSPHADDAGESRHPALIVGDPLENTNGDYILVQITSKPWHGRTDVALNVSDPEFSRTGLKVASSVRCHKLFPLVEDRVRRKIGSAGPNTMKQIAPL